MELQNEYGEQFFCLPDNAICEASGENPMDMWECPLKKFDLWGDICCPLLCDYYSES